MDGSRTTGISESKERSRTGDERIGKGGATRFFDGDERLKALSGGRALDRLVRIINFEVFRVDLEAALSRSDRAKGVRPPYDAVLMFKVLVLVLQTLYTLSDDQTEYQLRDRLSFMRFVGLALHDAVPDANPIWLYREQLASAGAAEWLFARFDALLKAKSWAGSMGEPCLRDGTARRRGHSVSAKPACYTADPPKNDPVDPPRASNHCTKLGYSRPPSKHTTPW